MTESEIDKSHVDYKGGYSDAVNDRYMPPEVDTSWFVYQQGWQAGLKQVRLTRLLEGKVARSRW